MNALRKWFAQIQREATRDPLPEPVSMVEHPLHESVVTIDDIDAKLEREDAPAFKVVYSCGVGRGITMRVALKTFLGGRLDMSELRQRNGAWVLFDLRRPADKILDREILPEVQRRCAQIIELDRAFVASEPTEFTDSRGHRWIRG